ncbi:MAG: hypothetical protein WD845_12475 [Pirellulales bacterium]
MLGFLMLRPRLPFAGLLAVALLPSGAFAADETPEWWQVQCDVTAALLKPETSIAELAANLSKTQPQNGYEALFKVSVLMRTGMHDQTVVALRQLKAVSPQLGAHFINSMYYDACDNLGAWDAAKALVEIFADVAPVSLENRLLKHLLESGWTVEQVDAWLAGMPKGIDSFWVKERLRFNSEHGRGDALANDWSNRVHANPQDIKGAIEFLDALANALRPADKKPDVTWMADGLKPALATQADRIAALLMELEQWQTAIAFYKQAIDIPLTGGEIRELRMMCASLVTEATLRAMFAVRTREAMAQCLLRLNENDQAQQWMVAAADLREKHQLGNNALFAGETQAASGVRVIEGRIKAKEQLSEHDPQYWQERAHYYRGRGEPTEEEQALVKGLELTRPQLPPEPERPVGRRVDWRSMLLREYVQFLISEKRTDEAVTLVRKEIEQAPALAASTQQAVHRLTFDFEKHVSADDEVLWRWLENRPRWEYAEEGLLWRMLENVAGDPALDRGDVDPFGATKGRRAGANLDKQLSRAERAAVGKDPTRANTVGWIMNRMGFPKRSIPLLEWAVENADDAELKERAEFTLFESYLDTGDWKNAEEHFPDEGKQLGPLEVPRWYSRLALAAAKAGAKEDAMRLWGVAANVSPCRFDGLKPLANAGLKDDLKHFYRQMQKQMPKSDVPAKALAALEE